MKSLRRVGIMITVWGFLVAIMTICASQTAPSPFEFSGQHLRGTPFHLPASMTLQDQMRFQEHLPTHQEIRVEWDSLPGLPHDRRLDQAEVEGVPLSTAFVLLRRKQAVKGAPGKINFSLGSDVLVVLAATESAEIGSLNVIPDLRIQDAEGHRFVTAKVAFTINLPDDPQISQVVFFKPAFRGDHFELSQLGRLKLTG